MTSHLIDDNDIQLPETQEEQAMVTNLVRAEIDIQVGTAHKYPRQMTIVSRNIVSLATISQEAAAACMYALPRGGKPITGPSIRLAEIVVSQWGNCRVGARIIDVDKKNGFVEAEGIFHDLQTNAAVTKRTRRRIFDRNGKVFSDDMILVTGNAACSIALRNAIFAGVPQAIWGGAYEKAIATMRGDMKTLPERREEALKAMAALGMTKDQVFQVLGIAGEADFGLDQMVTLGGIHNALKEGEYTVDQLLKNAGADQATAKPKSGDIVDSDAGAEKSKAKAAEKPKEKPKAETKPKAKPAEKKAPPKKEDEPKPEPKKQEGPDQADDQTQSDEEDQQQEASDDVHQDGDGFGEVQGDDEANEGLVQLIEVELQECDTIADIEECMEMFGGQIDTLEGTEYHSLIKAAEKARREALS